LTLNFQDITVREALNVIADFTELNMVISDSVEGKLTLRLKDVPWDQALDIILQSKELDMRRNGNVIRVAPRKELAEQEKADLTARREILELEELHTESFRLGYANVAEVANLLSGGDNNAAKEKTGLKSESAVNTDLVGGVRTSTKELLMTGGRLLTAKGSVVADTRTSTLFVTDTANTLEAVRKLIKQIDVPSRQVLIEARVVEANDGFARNLGVKLGYTGQPVVAAGGANGVTGIRGGMTGGTSNINLPAIVAAPLTNVFQFSLFNAAATKILNIELNAMESDSQGKIISSPRVVSADKGEDWALIEQGEEIPYTTETISAAGVTRTTSFRKAVLSLKVKTKITPDNNVDMTVQVQKDSRGDLVGVNYTIQKNTVETKVLVENGGTVVIGGVYKQNDQKTVNKVPLLGDIPVLGYLFKSKGISTTKSELLVFLSPKIMQDSLNLR